MKAGGSSFKMPRQLSLFVVRAVASVVRRAIGGIPCICLPLMLLLAGCGSGATYRERSVVGLGDTVRVRVRGTTIVVPAPDGFSDVMSVARIPPRAGAHGDVVWGMFQPRERVNEVLRHGVHTGLHVMLSLSQESAGPVPRDSLSFAALCKSWREAAARSVSPEGARVAKALSRWRHTAEDGDLGLGNLPNDARYVVAFEAPARGICRLVTIMRSSEDRPGSAEVWCDTRVLVRGRILTLNWSRASSATVRDLAEVCDASEGWARRVLAANP